MRILTSSRLLALFLLMVAILVTARLVMPGATPPLLELLGDETRTALVRPFFNLGKTPVTPSLLIKAAAFLVLLLVAVRLTRRFVQDLLVHRSSMDEGQRYATVRVAGYVVFFVGLMVGLQSAGLDLSSLAFFGGAAGLGIGFGMQTIASNFISGLILLFERPIKVGDRVDIGGTPGTVTRIGARATWVRGNDNVVVIVPNSEFVTSRVINLTAMGSRARFSIPVQVSYRMDPLAVREVLLSVARGNPEVLASPPPDVVLTRLGDNGICLDLRVWTSTRVDTPGVLSSDLYFAICEAFREKGIEIPFPQRDLHIKSVAAPMTLSGGV